MSNPNPKSLSPADFINVVQQPDLIDRLFKEHAKVLETEVPPTCNAYTHAGPENRPLFKHNRVNLPGKEDSTIINASYIQGYKQSKAYIATETPQSAKGAEALWKTVWQHRTKIVVMLNKPEGNERGYCYWSPGIETSLQFGKLKVRTVRIQTILPTFQVTELEVINEKGHSLTVHHFLYFKWPVHDNLPPTYDFLRFLFTVRKNNEKVVGSKGSNRKQNPILVHCSNGLERTMVFCAIDMLISMYSQTKKINIFSMVLGLKKERLNCLSNRSYYFFCYDVFRNYFINGSSALSLTYV